MKPVAFIKFKYLFNETRAPSININIYLMSSILMNSIDCEQVSKDNPNPRDYHTYDYNADGGRSGNMVIDTADAADALFCLRYFDGGSYEVVCESKCFRVHEETKAVPSEPLPSGPALTMKMLPVEGNVQATWNLSSTKHTTTTSDYIGVSEVGSATDSYLIYVYNGTGAQNGEVTIDASGSLESGKKYVVRYFDAKSYNFVAETEPFSKVDETDSSESESTAALSPQNNEPALTMKVLSAGGKLQGTWNLTPQKHKATSSDYIGVSEKGSKPGSYLTYVYNAAGSQSGSITVDASGGYLTSGKEYVLRYFDAKTYNFVAETSAFRPAEDPSAAVSDAARQEKARKKQAANKVPVPPECVAYVASTPDVGEVITMVRGFMEQALQVGFLSSHLLSLLYPLSLLPSFRPSFLPPSLPAFCPLHFFLSTNFSSLLRFKSAHIAPLVPAARRNWKTC
jgi:hypothetical protein